MEAYEKFKEEEDIYTFCIERRREADAMVRAEELRLEREQGVEEGRQLEATRLNELAARMANDGRADEYMAATTDPELQQKLLAEYQL